MSLIVVESPFAGNVTRNVAYAGMVCRELTLAGLTPLAPHLHCPRYLDDEDELERGLGLQWDWAWLPDIPHWFWMDLGLSPGMEFAKRMCERLRIPIQFEKLSNYAPDAWEEFQRSWS